MSKHKDTPPLADWEVHLTSGSSVTVGQAWYERTKGDYVFHDETGVCYTFPVFSVTYIRRGDPVAHELLFGVEPYRGGFRVSCRCGFRIVATSAARAEHLMREHVSRPEREPGWDYAEATVSAPDGDYSEAAR